MAPPPLLLPLLLQRQRKIQKDRLMDQFSSVLKNFQAVQRDVTAKEKEFVQQVRTSSLSDAVSVRFLDRHLLSFLSLPETRPGYESAIVAQGRTMPGGYALVLCFSSKT